MQHVIEAALPHWTGQARQLQVGVDVWMRLGDAVRIEVESGQTPLEQSGRVVVSPLSSRPRGTG